MFLEKLYDSLSTYKYIYIYSFLMASVKLDLQLLNSMSNQIFKFELDSIEESQ